MQPALLDAIRQRRANPDLAPVGGSVLGPPTRWRAPEAGQLAQASFNIKGERGLTLKFGQGGGERKIISVVANGGFKPTELKADTVPYFEIKIRQNQANSTIGLGFTSSFPALESLPGWWQNSYGLLSDGNAYHNRIGSKAAFGTPFGEGDTIGCGVMIDTWNQRQLFFTLNGEMLGTVPSFPDVPAGMFPLVPCCGSNGPCRIAVNFGYKPFRFQPSPSLLKPHKKNYIRCLPRELLCVIIGLAATSHLVVGLTLSRICKEWNEIANQESVWKALFLQRWRNQNSQLKAQNWHKLFKARYKVVSTPGFSDSVIENCAFDFLCPMTWEALQPTTDPTTLANTILERERFCTICNQTVYRVDTPGQLQQAVQLGRCASIVIPKPSLLDLIQGSRLTGMLIRDLQINHASSDDEDDWD